MKILLDECVPRKLKREFPDHEVMTVVQRGWSGKKNGELLRLMATEFDIFITIDQNLQYQQNLEGATICIIVIHAPSNRLEALLPLVSEIKEAIANVKSGEIIHTGS